MSDFASNTPISRPRRVSWTSDWDLNGLQWSFDQGVFYDVQDDMVPLRKPQPRTDR